MHYWIAVDWGTTNFRAYLMDKTAAVVDEIESNQGLSSVPQGDFANTLLNHIKKWQNITDLATTAVYMAGMVGSRQGWKEVDYLPTPLSLYHLKNHLYRFTLPWGADAFIVPGVCTTNQFGLYDVMRGEETQLLGLNCIAHAENLSAILPGTHSKQVVIEKQKLVAFSTVMTGELFALLNQHSILTKNIPTEYDDPEGFLLGVQKGYLHPLNSILFSTRTLLLHHTLSPSQVRAYLSGLLIGNELALLDEHQHFYIIGSKDIAQKYLTAANYLNKKAEILDGRTCFLKGISQIQQ